MLGSQRGSSPLARGKRDLRRIERVAVRLIPARAGKTSSRPSVATSRRAHPRSRGENGLGEDGFALELGSSPLARGKPPYGVGVVGAWWLIPARAGKTTRVGPAGSSQWAHPRSRGENVHLPGRARVRRGSSPLARGKRSALLPPGGEHGLIPARAGKTAQAE